MRDAVLYTVAFWVFAGALWMDVWFLGGVLDRISTESMNVHVDFDSFWRSARALLGGGDIYDAGARLVNLNPPVWTVLISPLGLLEALDAYRLFVLLSVLGVIGYLAWTAEELRLRSAWAVVGSGLLLLSSPLLSTLALGQVYPVLTLGLVAAWISDRRDDQRLSGVALGLVVALKPSLAPVLLWPLVRRRWDSFSAACVSGLAASLLGFVVAGPSATLRYVGILSEGSANPYWDNASIPAAMARFFTEHPYGQNLFTLPWMVYVGYALGIGVLVLTAVRVRDGGEAGLWALVAASLLVSPIAWHNYLVLLGPGILLLLARGRGAPALLLLALQAIPAQWVLLWNDERTIPATFALTLYLYVLLAHWAVFFFAVGPANVDPGAAKA
ncbi:glycosyltransferase family 87 protein [Rubrobacter tropicus]|uniref:glycosyltransferase family 87 protein n=1 Tax=Rubrobacter tropicus TaxID=2653851 RepID=UPI00140E8D66|nr:glycosyltransferase family 87 protein [Rubrobacter tropicus]